MCVMVAWGLEASRRGQSEEEDQLEYQKSFSSLERENLLSSSDAQQVPPPTVGNDLMGWITWTQNDVFWCGCLQVASY
jgi:hypothetical protein